LRNSMAYLAGLSGSYFVCGVCGYLAIDQLRAFLDTYILSTASLSNALYYQSEFIIGIVMVLIGILYFHKKRHSTANSYQNFIVSKLRSMNSFFAFGIGAFISISSFPLSIPYIIALGKYSTLQFSLPEAIGNILLYNVGYALPMIVIYIIYLYARKRTDDISDTLHEKTRILNVQLTTWALVGVGIFSMIDAGCYFTIGHSLVKGRFLI
jgi:cytochrome c biogenesis protein CcdA